MQANEQNKVEVWEKDDYYYFLVYVAHNGPYIAQREWKRYYLEESKMEGLAKGCFKVPINACKSFYGAWLTAAKKAFAHPAFSQLSTVRKWRLIYERENYDIERLASLNPECSFEDLCEKWMARSTVNQILRDFLKLKTPLKSEAIRGDGVVKCYDELLKYLSVKVSQYSYFSVLRMDEGEGQQADRTFEKKGKLITHMNKCHEERYEIILFAFIKNLDCFNRDTDTHIIPSSEVEHQLSIFLTDFGLKYHPDIEKEAALISPDFRSMYTLGIDWSKRLEAGFLSLKNLQRQFQKFRSLFPCFNHEPNSEVEGKQGDLFVPKSDGLRTKAASYGLLKVNPHMLPNNLNLETLLGNFTELSNDDQADYSSVVTMLKVFKMANAEIQNNLICFNIDLYRRENKVRLKSDGSIYEELKDLGLPEKKKKVQQRKSQKEKDAVKIEEIVYYES